MGSAEAKAEPAAPVPPAWRSLVGHDETVAAWQSLLATDRMPPVLLITGREGIGKRGLLAALAALHVCAAGTACGECEPCRWLLAGRHPEVLWLAAQGGRLLNDDAEALQEHLELSPTPPARWRVAVIVDADQLSTQAANRLLKTLEEPPPRGRILLSTSRAGAMLATVLSRCVRWRVLPPPRAATMALLETRAKAAGQPLPDAGTIDEIMRRAGLAPGLALRLLGLEGQDEAARPDLSALTSGRGAAAVSAAAQRLSREDGWMLPELLAQWEVDLNRLYREALSRGAPRPGPGAVARRRDLLRQARRLARGGNVPLNAQLVLEALANTSREL